MTTGVTTRLQRKSRNTSRSSGPSAAAASSDSHTSTSNSISTARTSISSQAPLPTVTVTVKSSPQSQEVAKADDVDPLCIRSMSETASSPALSGNANNATRRASSTGNQSNEPSTFASAKIKVDPDGDVEMKTEPDSNSWSSPYPPNGLNVKHEIKTEEIKQEDKSGSQDATMKDDSNQNKDEKKLEIKKESEDKENEDGKRELRNAPHLSRRNHNFPFTQFSVKNKNPSVMEINDDEWNDVEAR